MEGRDLSASQEQSAGSGHPRLLIAIERENYWAPPARRSRAGQGRAGQRSSRKVDEMVTSRYLDTRESKLTAIKQFIK